MNIFGTVCYAYVHEGKKKLDPRAEKGIFVGYDKYSPAYFVYFHKKNSVKKVRLVTFTNDYLDNKREATPQIQNANEEMEFTPLITNDQAVDTETSDNIPSSLSGEEEKNGDHNDHDQSEDQIVDEDTNEETYNDNATTHLIENDRDTAYPSRERKPPSYLKDYFTGEDSSDFLNLCETKNTPTTYTQAISSPDAEKWRTAMEKEMHSIQESNTFTLTSLPEDRNVVGGKWVYTIKEDDSNKSEYKARYVAKGYSQIKDVDYHETYAPTTKMTTIRTLMQLAAQYNLTVHQMDVKSAYLNAEIDCDIFVEQPEGYIVPGKEELVWKLNKSLYGLKQSGRNWNNLLNKELLGENFEQSKIDPCMFIKFNNDKMNIILVWVDDILNAASDLDSLNEVKAKLMLKFEMKDLGQISRFLGIDFKIKPDEIRMSQHVYTEKLLEKYNMLDCKPRLTPCEQKLSFSEDADPFDPTTYREAIGSLIYLSTCTRPDITWIVNKLSQFNQNPTIQHWTAVKHVLRYLKGTTNFCLSFRKCKDGLNLTGYTDADWGSSEDRRSTSGYCFSLNENGPTISWKSKKQPTVALSTCEAEYVAMTPAIQEAEYLLKLVNAMDRTTVLKEVTLNSDNQSAICVAKNPVTSQRIKHIDLKYHFIRDKINDGTIKMKYVPTDKNTADCFTKPLAKIRLDSVKPRLSGFQV